MVSVVSDREDHEVAERDLRQAADEARRAVAERPGDPEAAAWLHDAVQRYSQAFPREPRKVEVVAPAVEEARKLIAARNLEEAEVLLRKHLASVRNDAPAMHLMAEIAALCDLREDAERILKHSRQIHANSPQAMADLGMTLHRIACQKDFPEFVFEAARALDRAIELDANHEPAMGFKAAMMMQTRGLDQARSTYESLLDLNPHAAMHWLNYGYLLKTVGEFGPALAAYRTAIALDPNIGSTWWALADLKSAGLFASDIEAMETVLESDKSTDSSKVDIHFALMKTLDAAGQYERAVFHLEEGSQLRRRIQASEPPVITAGQGLVRHLFTREFFAKREGWGDPRPGPIFIIGMHRAGSTLVEQILATHSQIEGTEELFILHQFAGELVRANPGQEPANIVGSLVEADWRTFGNRYFEIATRSRRTTRPLFTDKNPGNWQFIGLIHCMLPNAKIIDVRRNPMDCCFANYARHYRNGLNYSYSQTDLGHYYSDYVATMRRFDEILPGRVHRVIHDDLVDNLEREVRRLLEFVGVPFEEDCLRFFETERAVHTPSSEQVRQPINRKGFGRWRNYENWLRPLKDALGETLENWRG